MTSFEPTQTEHTALIIDDNWYNRDLFNMALQNAGYLVVEAEDGHIGLSMLEAQKFALLVLDLHMPDIDGFEVLRRVRHQPLYDAMRVVVVTANAHLATEDVRDLADYVMFKPIDIMEFSRFTKRIQKTFTK